MVIGEIIIALSHIPVNGSRDPLADISSPDLVKMKYNRKNKMAISTGHPSPPFLTIAPSGAPKKKSIKTA